MRWSDAQGSQSGRLDAQEKIIEMTPTAETRRVGLANWEFTQYREAGTQCYFQWVFSALYGQA